MPILAQIIQSAILSILTEQLENTPYDFNLEQVKCQVTINIDKQYLKNRHARKLHSSPIELCTRHRLIINNI